MVKKSKQPDGGEMKEEISQTDKSSESTESTESTESIEAKKETTNGLNFDIMDFSEIFPLGASIINCLHVSLSNISITMKSGKY